jgi:hypothetical protein
MQKIRRGTIISANEGPCFRVTLTKPISECLNESLTELSEPDTILDRMSWKFDTKQKGEVLNILKQNGNEVEGVSIYEN